MSILTSGRLAACFSSPPSGSSRLNPSWVFLSSAVFGLTFLSVSDRCWHTTPASLLHFEYQTTRLMNFCLSLPLSARSGTHLWKVQTLGSLSSSPSAWWLPLTSFFMDCRLSTSRRIFSADFASTAALFHTAGIGLPSTYTCKNSSL